MYHKMRYYQNLQVSMSGASVASSDSIPVFRIPSHILPPNLFFLSGEKVGSITTIFSIWNTMMGSTLLALPWAYSQSGVVIGSGITVFYGLLCLYGCLLILWNGSNHSDFVAVCNHFLGENYGRLATAFSVLSMIGVCTVYFVIMSESLYGFVELILMRIVWTNPVEHDGPVFWLWNRDTAPILMCLLLLPLTLLKNLASIMKLNQVGIVNVFYVLFFVIYKSVGPDAGIPQLSLSEGARQVDLGSPNFLHLGGVLMMSFYFHNMVISVMKCNRSPENNARDLFIAYSLVILCYLVVGLLPNFAFAGQPMMENFIEMFPIHDTLTFIARSGLLLQLSSIYPFLLYICRVEVLLPMMGDSYPSVPPVVLLNTSVMVVGVVVSIYFPRIGTLLRYTGAVCGFVYIFFLPTCVHLVAQRHAVGRHRGWLVVVHVLILLVGLLTVIAQFVIT
eukprot:Rmarinus@m.27979